MEEEEESKNAVWQMLVRVMNGVSDLFCFFFRARNMWHYSRPFELRRNGNRVTGVQEWRVKA